VSRWKIELEPERGLLSLDAGGKVDGWTVVESIPGSPHAIIELPDDWDASRVDQEMTRLQAEGVIVDDGNGLYRPEHVDYEIMGWGAVVPRKPSGAPADTSDSGDPHAGLGWWSLE
jgi:hypothetical protein